LHVLLDACFKQLSTLGLNLDDAALLAISGWQQQCCGSSDMAALHVA